MNNLDLEPITIDDRLYALATNVILAAAYAHGRLPPLTDDDMRRLRAIYKLLPRTVPEGGQAPVEAVVPTYQPTRDSALDAVEAALGKMADLNVA